ncbi:bifunctional phosphopantothenoylcysteine decarboxylase/phosphopantothenate--cysteine ligase CoaBC [Puniceicoccaceae bacterium K14]|nr:bifunctional phosphopantothenoylcysteine decarboxylase/phosphopantothenate--cysteine ligase CoaBC [Puniceicoccaceae bacterium K14]
MLEGKRILLIVTGSIAAYKSLELVRQFIKANASVEGILTQGGSQFVTPLALETLTGKRVHTQMWDEHSFEMNHIEASRRADLIVVAPATAGFIAKMANGIGDDLASSIILAGNKPVIIAPSMNVEMWDNPAFRRNLEQVQKDGAILIEPQNDVLACGEIGMGKMAEPETIFREVSKYLSQKKSLSGLKAIVTTGGTIERIDSVRYLSNFSSGKQGNQIALALATLGCQVSLVSGNTQDSAPLHSNISIIPVESADQMMAAAHKNLPADLFVGCAAVCDFKVSNKSNKKTKKQEGLELEFEENPDILQSMGTLKASLRPKLVIGFAAETNDVTDYAKQKLEKKGCDLVIANDVSSGAVFGKDDTQVHFVSREAINSLEPMKKSEVADILASWIAEHL